MDSGDLLHGDRPVAGDTLGFNPVADTLLTNLLPGFLGEFVCQGGLAIGPTDCFLECFEFVHE